MTSNSRILAIAGAVALVGIGVYFFNESQKSDVEKLGDSLEEAGEEIADAVDDATN